ATPATASPRPTPDREAPPPKPVEAGAAPSDATARVFVPGRSSRQLSQELMQQALGELIGEITGAEAEPQEEEQEEEEETWRSDRLARDLAVDATLVSDALESLATRGRVLITGPLATGKSYLARRLALHVAQRDERILYLRVHPGLAYDDLVEARLADG